MKIRINFLLSLLFIIVFATSCNKEEVIITELDSTNASTAETRNNTQQFVPYLDLFSAHLNNYRAVDPGIYLPPQTYQEFTSRLEIEMRTMENSGFATYVGDLERDDKISSETADLMSYIYNSVDTVNNVDVSILKQDLLISYAPTDSISNEDPLYNYIYNVALQIYDDYINSNSTSATPYGDCPFIDFVQHVIGAAATGAGIGGWLGAAIQGGEDGLSLLLIYLESLLRSQEPLLAQR